MDPLSKRSTALPAVWSYAIVILFSAARLTESGRGPMSTQTQEWLRQRAACCTAWTMLGMQLRGAHLSACCACIMLSKNSMPPSRWLAPVQLPPEASAAPACDGAGEAQAAGYASLPLSGHRATAAWRVAACEKLPAHR